MRLLHRLGGPTGGRPLAAFRILFGLAFLAAIGLLWLNAGPIFLTPKFIFSYPNLTSLRAWPGDGLHWHLGVMAASAVAVMIGLAYRWAAALLFLGAAYLFLLDRTFYSDVLYLGVVLAFTMTFLPAHACWSLDAARRGQPSSASIPAWSQLVPAAVLLAMLLAATINLLEAYKVGGGPVADQLRRASAQPAVYALMFSSAGLLILVASVRPAPTAAVSPLGTARSVGLIVLGLLVLLHLGLPLRALAERGNTGWLAAGQQPLTASECAAVFNVRDTATTKRWNVNPGTRLNPLQAERMSRQPQLIREFARHLAEHFATPKYGSPEVTVKARVKCTQDGRRYALVLDPGRDLVAISDEELLDARVPFDPDAPARGLRFDRDR